VQQAVNYTPTNASSLENVRKMASHEENTVPDHVVDLAEPASAPAMVDVEMVGEVADGHLSVMEKSQQKAATLQRQYSNRVLNEGMLTALWVRLPWLLVALIGGLLAGLVISAFESELEEIVAIGFFIPVVMDMGGNMGTQSSTIFVRGITTGNINKQTARNVILREIAFGVVTGVIVGLLAFGFCYVWQGAIVKEGFAGRLAVTVGLSLIIICTLGATLGFMIPYAAHRIKLDSAAVSDPIITTVKDIIGLCIYFGLAKAIMRSELKSVEDEV